MPYYRWQGVDLQGKDRKGMTFSRSVENLDDLLMKRDVSLISAKQVRPLFMWPMGMALKIELFERLSTLLESGVNLPRALSILAESIESAYTQEVLVGIEQRVQCGKSFHEALADYPHLFTPMMIQMVNVGAEAGALPLSLSILALHLKTSHEFYKKIGSAAVLPLLTFIFFIAIMLIIFIMIMPLFSTVFESVGKQMPPMTLRIMSISNFLGSSQVLLWGVGIAFVVTFLFRLLGKQRRKRICDRMALSIPGISGLVIMSTGFSFFQSVAILLKGGVQMVPALQIGHETINNEAVKEATKPLVRSVESGCSLSEAFSSHRGPFSGPAVEAMIVVGQESGKLPEMILRIATDCKERAERKLSYYSMLFQPLVMIVLGFLIALLIVAVYTPILTLSSAIS